MAAGDPITWVLGSLVIAGSSGLIGAVVGSKGKVKEDTCRERRDADQVKLQDLKDYVALRFDTVEKQIDDLKDLF